MHWQTRQEGIAPRATVAGYAIKWSQTTTGGYEEPQIDGVLGERIYQVAQHEADNRWWMLYEV